MHASYAFDKLRFDTLPDIQDADRSVRSSGRLAQAREIMGSVITEHGMQQYWGLALLHKHWDIEAGELALQKKRADTPAEYVLSPVLTPPDRVVPSTLAASDRGPGFVAVEFSSVQTARVAYDEINRNQAFARDAEAALRSNALAEEFGLIALRVPPRPGFEFVEHTTNERSSILTETPVQLLGREKLIETSWEFVLDHIAGLCRDRCGCVCSISSDGRHSRSHQLNHASY